MTLTITEALRQAREQGLDRLDAQLLLADLFGQDRAWLISHDDALLTAAQTATLAQQVAQRAAGMPLAYLVGVKEFHGLSLRVTADTLVPRPDTEVLVDWALALLAALPGQPRVVDLGTGSGAIALAIKHRHPAADVAAVELSAAALAVAEGNAQRLGMAVRFHQGSWWQPLAGQRFKLIVSNPPYIAAGDPHLPALRHEPLGALTPGGDGLSALLEIIDGAADHLQAEGWLLLEHGFDQADAVATALRTRGFTEVTLKRDLGGQPRVTGGKLP